MSSGERGRHDSHADDERPEEPQQPVGGSEWLLQQLSGGRLKSIFDTPRPDVYPAGAESGAEPAEENAPSEPDATPDPEPARTAAQPIEPEAEPAASPQSPEQLIDDDPAEAAELARLDEEVYQWPPVAAPDEPFVWEEIAEPIDEDEDDDDEFWRAATVDPRPEPAAGAFVWNLSPTIEQPVEPEEHEKAAEPEFEPIWEAASGGEQTWQPEDVHEAEIIDDDVPETEAELVLEEHHATRSTTYDEDADPDTVDESAADYAPLAYASTSARSHVNSTAPTGGRVSASGTPSLGGGSKRTVVIVAVSVGAVVVLGALLLLGMFLAAQSAPVADPAPTATAPATAEPTAALPTVGPLPAGTYAWNQLLGGECLQPMDNVWAEEFTVVDCGADHAAQLVTVGQIADVSAFPGTDALAAQVAGLCQANGVVDLAAAASFGDVQVQGTFPVTDEQWAAGERSYYCFVNRSGGGALTGSLVPAA